MNLNTELKEILKDVSVDDLKQYVQEREKPVEDYTCRNWKNIEVTYYKDLLFENDAQIYTIFSGDGICTPKKYVRYIILTKYGVSLYLKGTKFRPRKDDVILYDSEKGDGE